MGETVTKVLVDGEEFFGDDPGSKIYVPMPSRKYKFLIKKSDQLSSPELTMVKPKKQSICV
jgi:hypothetical protein